MNVLVTGAAGFIGSKLSSHLHAAGIRVLGVDNFSLGKPQNVPDEIDFIEADLSVAGEVRQKLHGLEPDAIVHLAGQSGGELSFSKTLFDCDSNVRSTLLLLEMAREQGISKFIHASSVAVYGETPSKLEDGLREDLVKKPTSPYGVSKLAAEEYLRTLSASYGISSTSLRFFNVYGPGQDFERLDQGMLSIYLSQALESRKIIVKGSTERYRDFVHVEDAIRACEKSLGLSHIGHMSLNVCTGVRTPVSQSLQIILEELGELIDIEVADSTPGDVLGWVGNTEKLEETLSWKPQIQFDTGFRETIRLEIADS